MLAHFEHLGLSAPVCVRVCAFACETNIAPRDVQLFMLYMNIGFEPVWFKIRIIYSRIFFFLVAPSIYSSDIRFLEFLSSESAWKFLQIYFAKMVHFSHKDTPEEKSSKWITFEFGGESLLKMQVN